MKRRTDLTPFETPAILHVVVDSEGSFLAGFGDDDSPVFVGDDLVSPNTAWLKRREALNWQFEDASEAQHWADKAKAFVKALRVNDAPAKLCGACGEVKSIVPVNWYKAPGRIGHLENRCKRCARKPVRNTCPRGLSTPGRATHGTQTRAAVVDAVKAEGAAQSAPQSDKASVLEQPRTGALRKGFAMFSNKK